jgi:23S rRNA pseudouridine1911/1915/1917 synthase
VAVVAGHPAGDRGTIDAPIGRDEGAAVELAMTVRPDGAPARTDWEVLARFAATSLVRFTLHTGRQHQIRVHARALGHPVLCDPLYADGPRQWPPGAAAPLLSRLALHARRLAFAHPRGGQRVECHAPLPDDLAALVAALGQG